jgi:hypothetical protein
MKKTDKKTFADKGKSILGERKPLSVKDFLESDGNTESRKTVLPETPSGVVAEPRTEREEFKLTKKLAQRLKRFAYEKDIKKVDVVTRALEELFDREGY